MENTDFPIVLKHTVADEVWIMQETVRFVKFKELVMEKLYSVDVNHWCLRHGIEIVQERNEFAPMEVFFLGLRLGGLPPEEADHGALDFISHVGDRVPVSDNEDFAYLFPRDMYEKVLLFQILPD